MNFLQSLVLEQRTWDRLCGPIPWKLLFRQCVPASFYRHTCTWRKLSGQDHCRWMPSLLWMNLSSRGILHKPEQLAWSHSLLLCQPCVVRCFADGDQRQLQVSALLRCPPPPNLPSSGNKQLRWQTAQVYCCPLPYIRELDRMEFLGDPFYLMSDHKWTGSAPPLRKQPTSSSICICLLLCSSQPNPFPWWWWISIGGYAIGLVPTPHSTRLKICGQS